MEAAKDEFGLRLAAKAADREKAARQEWPAFEARLTELGYGPRAIAHAFATLSGPGTVAEALEVLKRTSRPESEPIALRFEVTETRGGPAADDVATITSAERDDFGIRVTYETVGPLDAGPRGPQGVARDDLGNNYASLGSHFGHTRDRWRGMLTLPLPHPAATTLFIRITWDALGPSAAPSIWEGPAHEIRIELPQ